MDPFKTWKRKGTHHMLFIQSELMECLLLVILLTGEEIYMYFFHVCASLIESLLVLHLFHFHIIS